MKTLPVFLAIAALALVGLGAGCQKSSPPSTTPAGYESPAWLPSKTGSDVITPLAELRAALAAFQETKSFHADMSIMSNSNKITAKLDVMKPDRFRGTLQDASMPAPTDIIGVGKTLYIKSSSGNWSAILGSDLSAISSIADAAKNGGQLPIEQLLPDGTDVQRSEDAVRKCTKLVTTLQPKTDTESTLRVCVADGRPVQIEVESKKSTFSATYSNYNELFSIERPSIKK